MHTGPAWEQFRVHCLGQGHLGWDSNCRPCPLLICTLYHLSRSHCQQCSPLSAESEWRYLTPRNCGCSPGALDSLSIFKESMCAMEMTVAATYQGKPMKEHTAISTPTQNRSKWQPQLFCNVKMANVGKVWHLECYHDEVDTKSTQIFLFYFFFVI